jgi:hypothetical protein
MPPSIALRKEAQDALEEARGARSEAEVRAIVSEINDKIRAANRMGIQGPSLLLVPYDVDRIVRDWRRRRS